VGKDQIKAKQIQIEFIQVEHLPGSSESLILPRFNLMPKLMFDISAQVVASPIGSPINVWSASNGAEWEYATNVFLLRVLDNVYLLIPSLSALTGRLQSRYFTKRFRRVKSLTINLVSQFYIPLPLNLPGSVELKQKGGAIRYELQANFYHKPKS
jgi:hypothetical protein